MIYRIVMVFLCPALAMPLWAQSSQPALSSLSDQQCKNLCQKVQKKLDEEAVVWVFPGVTVGFMLPDGRSAGISTGFADLESKIKLKPADRMLAGSIGKTFVAAVLLQLVEEGRIALDDPLSKWLGKEGWYARLPNGADLTVRMLALQTSGLPEYFEVKGFMRALTGNADKVWKPSELISFILDAKPLFPAGKGWSYADTNYILIGMIIEKATGKPLFEEIDRRLLKPWKLERTIASDRRVIPGLIPGYAAQGNPLGYTGRTILDGQFVINPQMEYAGGGLASTAEDLAKWGRLLYEGKVFQKKETLALLLSGVDASGGRGGGKGTKYGVGVQIRESPWGISYGHGGWFPGYLSEVEYFPEHHISVAVQFNSDNRREIKKGLRAYIGDVTRILLAAEND